MMVPMTLRTRQERGLSGLQLLREQPLACCMSEGLSFLYRNLDIRPGSLSLLPGYELNAARLK